MAAETAETAETAMGTTMKATASAAEIGATVTTGATVATVATVAEIWARMLEGNRRFAENRAERPHGGAAAREALLAGQHPHAVILGCSDSRVAPEILFDEGLGDLFDVRTAGEVVDTAVLETIEYAVADLQVPLLVVLGHQHCGAVVAVREVLKAAQQAGDEARDVENRARAKNEADEAGEERDAESDSLLVRSLSRAVREALAEREADDVALSNAQSHDAALDSSLNDDIERIHVAHVIEDLVDGSALLRKALQDGKLHIVGARYVMETGLVEVLSM